WADPIRSRHRHSTQWSVREGVGETRLRPCGHACAAVVPRVRVYSTRFPWTPLWGSRGGPEENGGMLTERQLNGSGELPERWSAKRKTEIVLRLLRGEDLGQISREIQVAPQVIEEWRRAFLAGAEAGLKKRGGDPLESELVRTRAKLG